MPPWMKFSRIWHKGAMVFCGLLLIFTCGAFTHPDFDQHEWYVSTQGSDQNTCHSPDSACRLIATAVSRALPGDSIHIAAGRYNEALWIDKSLRLEGESPETTILNAFGLHRPVITLGGSSTPLDLALERLALQGGSAANGGGLYVKAATSVTLKNVSVYENSAQARGGGIYIANTRLSTLENVSINFNHAGIEGGGIYFDGSQQLPANQSLNLLHVTLRGNRASSGGGLYSRGETSLDATTVAANNALRDGGGVYNADSLRVSLSRLQYNRAGSSGGGICSVDGSVSGNLTEVTTTTLIGNSAGIGGGIYNQGELMLIASTLLENQARLNGGGVFNGHYGSALKNRFYAVNSTFGRNSAQNGGAVWSGDFMTSGNFQGVNLTIAENSGGGIFFKSGSLDLENVLMAQNNGGNCLFSQSAPVKVRTNISDDESCQGFIQTRAGLGALGDNGGPTWTYALLPGSAAIDTATDVPGLFQDQRGVFRPSEGNGDGIADLDIGAYEVEFTSYSQSDLLTYLPATPAAALTGISFTPVQNLSCRTGPGAAFTPLAVAIQGQTFPVDARNSNSTWILIRMPGNVECWLIAERGEVSGEVNNLPVQLVPTPTPIQ